jgi:hypothetical protein
MASMIDSCREVFNDKLSFLKIIVLSVPVYFCYQLYMNAKGNYAGFFVLAVITLFFLLGFLIKIINNIINEREYILPSLNPFKLIFSTIKALIGIGPSVLITISLSNYVCSIINIIPWLDITLKTLIWIITAAVIITSLLMFTVKERIIDAYNIKLLFEKAGELIVVLLVFAIILVLINLPTMFIAYVLMFLFGFGPILNIFLSMAFIFNIAITGHYFGQVHYEVFNVDKVIF